MPIPLRRRSMAYSVIRMAVFGEQANQHDDTRLQVDVVLQSHNLGKEERTHQPERYGEDDGKRNQETLIKTCQDEIDQEDTNGKIKTVLLHHQSGLPRVPYLVLVTVAPRQRLYCHFRNGTFCTSPDEYPSAGFPFAAIALYRLKRFAVSGPSTLVQRDELADRSHLAVPFMRTRRYYPVPVRPDDIWAIGLHHDAVHLAKLIVVGNTAPP